VRTATALLAAAHGGPALAVTAITALLAVGTQAEPGTGLLVTTAVLAGQLTIGWGNDLLDVRRDQQVGRSDKPLATGALSVRLVRGSLGAAAVLCLVLSAAAGSHSALTHLALVVLSGHVYNLGAKATAVSWLPYAVAFGSLPAVVTLAGDSPALPPWWMVAAAAALGVAAHFLNALPDLSADVATGVRGIPHRLGAGPSRWVATLLLVAASLAAALGPGRPSVVAGVAVAAVVALAVVALVGQGRTPFRAAITIALIDVTLLVVAG
jgi:4-hydroxybenzoate polyprenyltransferase